MLLPNIYCRESACIDLHAISVLLLLQHCFLHLISTPKSRSQRSLTWSRNSPTRAAEMLYKDKSAKPFLYTPTIHGPWFFHGAPIRNKSLRATRQYRGRLTKQEIYYKVFWGQNIFKVDINKYLERLESEDQKIFQF